jgi:hypothetical protein
VRRGARAPDGRAADGATRAVVRAARRPGVAKSGDVAKAGVDRGAGAGARAVRHRRQPAARRERERSRAYLPVRPTDRMMWGNL